MRVLTVVGLPLFFPVFYFLFLFLLPDDFHLRLVVSPTLDCFHLFSPLV